jgi:hypothetical protein
MKKITLLMSAVLTAAMSFSQIVVRMTDVPCNTGLEGSYPYQISDWALTPDMFLGINAAAGPLEFINDGTPGIVGDGIAPHGANIGSPPLQNVPKGYLACDTTNAPTQDMTGKIAVCYRGSCEFGYKAYNAQLRGAIAIIIINHTGDAVGMAAGAYGDLVTIPIVQIGRVAGDDIRVAIESCAPGTVMGFIGSKVGLFNNDIGSTIADIVMPNELSIPSNVAINGTNYPLDFGIYAYNYGINAQSGVTATVNVVHEIDGNVYSNTSTPTNFFAPNLTTALIDTQYFALGTFAPATWGQGQYVITYTLNLPGDEDPTDNTFSINFRVTSTAFAKASTSAGNEPIATTSFSLNTSSTQYDYWESCILFRSPVVATSTPGGGIAQSMTFSATPINGVMTDEILELRAYTWNDAFTDITGTVTFNSLTQVGDGLYYFAGTPDSLDNITVDFDAPFALANNQRYLFCVYNGADMLRIGFDSKIDYTATINNYLQPISPVRTKAVGANATWYRDGFGWDVTPAIALNIDFPTAVNNVVETTTAVPYPNPAVNMLNVPVRKGVKGNVTVEVYDLAGKLVISENKTIGEGPLKINVASISNGAYMFSLTFADGSKDAFKVSVNR